MSVPKIVYFTPHPPHFIASILKDIAEPESLVSGGTRGTTDEETMCEAVKDATLILVNPTSPKISRRVLEAAEQVRLVLNLVVGYDNIDLEAATELGIPVANNPGWNSARARHSVAIQ